jgi:hypothetical protein
MTNHGTYSSYIQGCRCESCKKANSSYHLLRRNKRIIQIDSFCLKHGKNSTYVNYGCRCDLCTKVASKRHKKYEERVRHESNEKAIVITSGQLV